MPTILNDSPTFNFPTPLLLPDGSSLTDPYGQPIWAARNHIIMWASLLPEGQPINRARMKRFAVVVDTGFTDTLILREDQLVNWVGTRLHRLLPAVTPGSFRHRLTFPNGVQILKHRAEAFGVPQPPRPTRRPGSRGDSG